MLSPHYAGDQFWLHQLQLRLLVGRKFLAIQPFGLQLLYAV